ALASYIFQALFAAGLTHNPSEMSLSAGTAHILQDIGFHPIDLTPYVVDISAGTPAHSIMFEDMKVGTALLKPFVVDRMHQCTDAEFDHYSQEAERIWQDPQFSAHWYLCAVCVVKPEAG
ncbi:MAG: hypothetical protein ACRDHW_09120, partial [Ktedonobacteraceae bacterium]